MARDKPYGYPVSSGYMGLINNNVWMLFATEDDYIEYIS